MSSHSNLEREMLKRFATVFADFGLTEYPDEPSQLFFSGMKAVVPRAGAIAGLRMAVADLVEMSGDFSPEVVARLERRLEAEELPSLSSMRSAAARKVQAILLRGRIGTEAEYRLLSERVCDVSESGIADADRNRAEEMLSEFETSR